MNESATYRMVCTTCGFSRATTDITEIHGIAPAFCACGEIMVPELEHGGEINQAEGQ